MRRKPLWSGVCALLLLAGLGCRHHVASGSETKVQTALGSTAEAGEPDSRQEPAPDASREALKAIEPSGRERIDGGNQDGDLPPFGIFVPVFPGLGSQTVSAKCDPFDDSIGVCL